MATYPTLSMNPATLEEGSYKRQIKTEFETGQVHSRPGATRARGKWTLSYSNLPDLDYQSLKTFFEANIGDTFTWTHPTTAVSKTVRFSEDTFTGKQTANYPGFWDVDFQVEEN